MLRFLLLAEQESGRRVDSERPEYSVSGIDVTEVRLPRGSSVWDGRRRDRAVLGVRKFSPRQRPSSDHHGVDVRLV